MVRVVGLAALVLPVLCERVKVHGGAAAMTGTGNGVHLLSMLKKNPEDVELQNAYRDITGEAFVETGSSGGSEAGAEEWVSLVNAKRAAHGACPVAWAQPLADGIKEWVDGLTSLRHSNSYYIPPPGGPAGENLAWASNGISAERAVEMWYGEVNDCPSLPGCQVPLPGKVTGHFTLLVWKGGKTLGCAISADGNHAGCRMKAGDRLSADTPNMGMPGLYEANVRQLGEAPTGC